MSRDDYNDYNMGKSSRSATEVKKKRARRKKMMVYKRLALLGFMAILAIVGVIIVISTIGGGCSTESESGTDKLQVNATENQSTSNKVEDSTKEEVTTEELTTEEVTTEDFYRYGDELYNDGELVVCIDAGHGGNDTGCIGVDDSMEKDDTLRLAKLVVKALEDKGVKVVTTRTTDVWVNLADRPVFANKQHADVFVSIHRNSLENDTVTKGFEAWINSVDSDKSKELANMIMENLELAGISRNRGVKKGTQGSSDENYRINSGSAMPSVLLEMGFMSSPKDNQLYRDNAVAYANAIADAIIQWSLDKPY